MKLQIKNNNGELTVTSIDIVNATGKEHKHVLRDIRTELGKTKLGQTTYKTKQGKHMPMYILTEYETLQLMCRYSRDIRSAVIKEFERMKEYIKEQQKPNSELSTLDVLKLATAEIQKLEERNNLLTDNLLAYQKYGKSITVREFVKIIYDNDKITIGEKEFWKLLRSQKYAMTNNLPYAKYKKYFEVVSKVYNGKMRNTTKISPKGVLYFTNKIIGMKGEKCEE